MDSAEEMTGRAGWNLLVVYLTSGDHDGLDCDAILRRIDPEMKLAPRYKQESMNRCLVEIGVRFPELRQRCIAIGERLGRLDDGRCQKAAPLPMRRSGSPLF
jgi:hypothetical protein